jgi:Na+-translocating ferredoxin:NAD+ oxidoreductase RNF subunit RnfB
VTSIILSAAILGGVGLTFGALIALANHRFKVFEDPRLDVLTDLLPGTNCGACGCAGCRAFAEELAEGSIQPAGCTVMGPDDIETIAEYMGVDAGEANKRVARLLCAGGCDVAPVAAEYRGLETCAAAAAVAGGGKSCAWGCLGLDDCMVACDLDAIFMSETDLPVVIVDKCTACGDCVDACPKDLFTIMPVDHALLVQCRSLLEGDRAEAACAVACNACGRCVMDAKPGVIAMMDGLAVIDYTKNELAGPEAIARCPTDAIVWVEEAQFADARPRAKEVAV